MYLCCVRCADNLTTWIACTLSASSPTSTIPHCSMTEGYTHDYVCQLEAEEPLYVHLVWILIAIIMHP